MSEKYLVLDRSIRNDLETIERLYEALGDPKLEEAEAQDTLIVIAYRLHSLYSAFENIFRNIASAFENNLGDGTGWHRTLLQRMRLDLLPVRPAVIDEEAFEKLDELLRFRHLFRTGYVLSLDGLRLQLVVRKALELKSIYPAQIEQFLHYLQ
jgi:hypothetical protein